jgi:hypothetical protein
VGTKPLKLKSKKDRNWELAISQKDWVVGAIAISLALVVLLCAAALAYGYVLKRTAANLVHDVAGLTLGRSTYADAQRIADSYRRFRVASWSKESTSCTPQKCFFNFDLTNSVISRVRLVRPAVLRITVAVYDDKVTSVDIAFWGGLNGTHGAFVQEAEQFTAREVGPYSFPTPVGKPYLRIAVTPEASAIEKQHAFTIDVDCLASWRSCDLGCDYLPLAWKDWKKELSTRGLDNDTLLVSYPESTRCR